MSLNQRHSGRELFSPTPNETSLRLWNKNFRVEIYRNIRTFAFQVLGECSSWSSRNDAVQMFFSDTDQKHQKHVSGCVVEVYFFIMLRELRFIK